MITLNWLFEHKNEIYEMSVEIDEFKDGGFLHTLRMAGSDIASWHWPRTFPPVITHAKAEHELKAILQGT